jgi:hypothetical protein
VGIGASLLEPRMFIRCVVDDKVDNDAHPALLAAVSELDKVAQRSVSRINGVVIADVVATVATGRTLERHQPQGCDAHAMQVIEPSKKTLKVTHSVAVCIHVSGDRKTIENCVLIPEIVNHGS